MSSIKVLDVIHSYKHEIRPVISLTFLARSQTSDLIHFIVRCCCGIWVSSPREDYRLGQVRLGLRFLKPNEVQKNSRSAPYVGLEPLGKPSQATNALISLQIYLSRAMQALLWFLFVFCLLLLEIFFVNRLWKINWKIKSQDQIAVALSSYGFKEFNRNRREKQHFLTKGKQFDSFDSEVDSNERVESWVSFASFWWRSEE